MTADDKEVVHARMPIGQTFRRSPFTGLFEHAGKLNTCITSLRAAVQAYVDADYEAFREKAKTVSLMEHEADLVKGNVRAHLPRFIFMPVSKTEFLMLLREVDSVMDYAKDVAVLLSMRKTPIPEELKVEFIDYTEKVAQTALDLEKVVFNLKELLETSFAGKERDETKEMIKAVHKGEWEADNLEAKLTRKVFNMKGDPIAVYHLLRVLDRMDQIANHAENAADRVRAMLAK